MKTCTAEARMDSATRVTLNNLCEQIKLAENANTSPHTLQKANEAAEALLIRIDTVNSLAGYNFQLLKFKKLNNVTLYN